MRRGVVEAFEKSWDFFNDVPPSRRERSLQPTHDWFDYAEADNGEKPIKFNGSGHSQA